MLFVGLVSVGLISAGLLSTQNTLSAVTHACVDVGGATAESCSSCRRVGHFHRLRRARTPKCIGPAARPGFGGRAAGSAATNLPVEIVATGVNSRRISASIIVNAAPNYVWSILTDYNNLATHVPNLVQSSLRPHPSNGIRLYQEGAQKIIGFDFRAALTMDMTEVTDDGARAPSRIRFSLVESQMFASFDGEWRVQPYSRSRSRSNPGKFDYRSKLSYLVNITPKGLVPVPALEWRIKEDVPVNLRAVRCARTPWVGLAPLPETR